MLDIAEAWAAVAAACRPLPAEDVPLEQSLGRVLAADAASVVDLPPFDRSAMDGYAVRSADTGPGVRLRLAGEVAAGDAGADTRLAPGTALGITTGAPIPPGADAILQVELASVADGSVEAAEAVPAGRHVRVRAEDVRAGDVLARAGERMTLQRVSGLASAGVGSVRAHRRPRVQVLITGDELLPVGAPPSPGRIHESNGVSLRLLAAAAGADVGVPGAGGIVPDDREATIAAVRGGLAGADVLLVSGGVSVGPHDHVKPAFEACGVQEGFWRVRIKPGKPLWFGHRDGTLVFGLPGNPLSSIVCFLAFVEPALRRLAGEPDAALRTVPARLAAPAGPSDGRTTFLTARFERGPDGVLVATPTRRQGSHMTGALATSDGFVVAPHGTGELGPGAMVQALLL